MSRSTMRFCSAWLGVALAGAVVIGCDGPPTDVPPPPPPPPPLTVTSTNPSSTFRDATLDVRVIGTGFAQGARAVWARNNDTTFATTKVKTNSTTFVSATELLTNITLQANAPFGKYSVKVVNTGSGNAEWPQGFTVSPLIETIDLGAGTGSTARGVNNVGQIVGDRGADLATVQAYLWENGTITNLGVLPGMTFSYAFDINESGVVVGVSGTGTLNSPISERGFSWTVGGGMVALSTLGGLISSAKAINNTGDIVGLSAVSGTSPGHAVVWRGGVITDLQPVSFAANQGSAFAINSPGEVVGNFYGAQAFRWTATAGIAALAGVGLPFGINDAGCIAGWTGGGLFQAHRLCAGVLVDLGTCDGLESRAWAINNAGQVVGDATNAVPVWIAFLWTESEGIACLSGAQESSALGINNNGWVVGYLGPFGAGKATLWKVK